MKSLIFTLMILFSFRCLGDISIVHYVPSLEAITHPLYLTRIELQRIFTRSDTRWGTGEPIIVYIKPMTSIEHRIFITSILRMTIYRYQQSLDSVLYSGRGLLYMHEVPNDEQMMMQVESHPGSIGYINYQLVSSNIEIIICEVQCP